MTKASRVYNDLVTKHNPCGYYLFRPDLTMAASRVTLKVILKKGENIMTKNANTKTKQTTGGIEAADYSWAIEDIPLWSNVLDGLWVGGTDDNDTLGDYRAWSGGQAFITPEFFDTVVTMYQYANPVDWLVKEYRYCIYDSDVNHFDWAELFATAKFAHTEWQSGKRVLIRCQAGLNRSGLVTALVLIREGYSPEEAISMIRERRSPDALFNRQFVEFLKTIDVEMWRGDVFVDTSVSDIEIN